MGGARVRVSGIELDPLSMEEAVARVKARLEEPGCAFAIGVNVDQIVLASRDPELRQAMGEALFCTADGTIILWLAALHGTPLPERVAGIDLMEALLPVAAAEAWPVFLLGAQPGISSAAGQIYAGRWPGLRIVGTHHGFWTDDDTVAREIADSGARLLFLGLSSPRKEHFLRKYGSQLGAVRFALGVGGAFDIAVGRTRRAPVWVSKLGLEWAIRLVQEPRRLWRRYLVRDLAIIPLLLADLWQQRTGPAADQAMAAARSQPSPSPMTRR